MLTNLRCHRSCGNHIKNIQFAFLFHDFQSMRIPDFLGVLREYDFFYDF